MIILDIPAMKLSLQCCGCQRYFPISKLRATCTEKGYELWCRECHEQLNATWTLTEVSTWPPLSGSVPQSKKTARQKQRQTTQEG